MLLVFGRPIEHLRVPAFRLLSAAADRARVLFRSTLGEARPFV
jgi:hypothetical protein